MATARSPVTAETPDGPSARIDAASHGSALAQSQRSSWRQPSASRASEDRISDSLIRRPLRLTNVDPHLPAGYLVIITKIEAGRTVVWGGGYWQTGLRDQSVVSTAAVAVLVRRWLSNRQRSQSFVTKDVVLPTRINHDHVVVPQVRTAPLCKEVVMEEQETAATIYPIYEAPILIELGEFNVDTLGWSGGLEDTIANRP
jgi:hypothetical protein